MIGRVKRIIDEWFSKGPLRPDPPVISSCDKDMLWAYGYQYNLVTKEIDFSLTRKDNHGIGHDRRR